MFDKKFETRSKVEPHKIFAKNNTLQSAPKSSLEKTGQIIPTKPKIPALNTLREVKSEAKIIKIILNLSASFPVLKASPVSSLKTFNFGINKAQIIITIIKRSKSSLFEISALLNPPVKINVIAYDFVGFISIKQAIKELTKRLKDKPIRINFVIENFEKPLNAITKIALISAPKKPKRE